MINHSTTDVKRHYDAARRREQPRQNHRRIIDTAERMFLSDGYSATTVQAIAAGAGVFADTIYKSFGGKPPGDPRSRARRGTL
ncbi:MAG: helix-turn-helix transcriptional regulator, partial [Solirubrobacterales bacterium]|nr:helix-turn-helix transcriptional regulator [Solirubrobacterales bacterium]